MEAVDEFVFGDEGGDGVCDVLEELEVGGVGGADYVAEDDEEGAEGVGEHCPVFFYVSGWRWMGG